LKDKYWHTRCEAAASLGKMGDSRAVKPLLKALKDSSEHVQCELRIKNEKCRISG